MKTFIYLLFERLGPPPQVLWVTCGNTSNARLREILTKSLPPAIELLQQGEPLVEISDAYIPPRGGKRLTSRSTRQRSRSGSGKRERSRSGRGGGPLSLGGKKWTKREILSHPARPKGGCRVEPRRRSDPQPT